MLIEFDIDREGQVRNPRIVASDPPETFDATALETVGGWKFSPALRDGKPVWEKDRRVKLRFELDRAPTQSQTID